MSSTPSSSSNPPGNPVVKVEMPPWMREFMDAQSLINQRLTDEMRELKQTVHRKEPEGEAGKAPEKSQEADSASSDDEPAADKLEAATKPPEQSRRSGKLDTATLNTFPEFGADDLSFAEMWIKKAGELAVKRNLDEDLLCLAVCVAKTAYNKKWLMDTWTGGATG